MPRTEAEKTLIYNRRARHEYFVEDSHETGIALLGTEVKSLRMGKANMGDSYAMIKDGELLLYSLHISPYEKENTFHRDRDPMRTRRLLMHKREINRLRSLTQQKGYSLIPLRIYLKGQLVKVELGVCKGKKLYDKREDEAKASAMRDIARAMSRDAREN